MPPILTCPNCGADLRADALSPKSVCPRCQQALPAVNDPSIQTAVTPFSAVTPPTSPASENQPIRHLVEVNLRKDAEPGDNTFPMKLAVGLVLSVVSGFALGWGGSSNEIHMLSVLGLFALVILLLVTQPLPPPAIQRFLFRNPHRIGPAVGCGVFALTAFSFFVLFFLACFAGLASH